MLIQIHENQKLIEKYWGGCGQKSCCYFSHRTVKQALYKEGGNGLNHFFTCWYRFRKAKSYLHNFGLVVAKKWEWPLGHETIESAVSQEQINEMNWLFAWLYKFGKAKNYVNNSCVGVVKNGHGTLNSPVSQEWIDELSRYFAF